MKILRSKGDDYFDGLFTLPSKYATILSFQIGRSVTLEGRLACLVRRTLISIMFWPKISAHDKRDLFQIAGYNSPKNPSEVMKFINILK